jgi:hypothetical protein
MKRFAFSSYAAPFKWARRIAATVAFAIVTAMPPAHAAGPSCQNHNLSTSADLIQEIAPLPTFDVCISAPLFGTLRGTFISCFKFADLVTSDGIWHDGDASFLVGRWHDEFRTPDGDVAITERGVADLSSGLQATMMLVLGGTGRYEGASGVLTITPAWPERLAGIAIRGTICTP